jgi:Tol biopolymer transport system component
VIAAGCSSAASAAPSESSPTAPPSPTAAPSPTRTPTPTTAFSRSCDPATLPSGRIAFTAGDGVANGISVINADGSGYRRLVEPKVIAGQPHGGTEGPSWVGSDRILFDSNRNGGPDDWHIFSVQDAGGEPEQITMGPAGIEYHVAASLDGTSLAYAKAVATGNSAEPLVDAGIFVSDRDGGNERQVTETPPGGVDEWPDISPDGKHIAFTRGHVGDGGLFVVNVDGSGLTKLVPAEMEPSRARWSADGSRIAFHVNGERFLTVSSNVWVVNADGSGLRQVTFENRDGQAFFPTWSPDDLSLLFVHHSSGSPTNDLAVIPSAGGVACTLWAGAPSNLAWESDWASP